MDIPYKKIKDLIDRNVRLTTERDAYKVIIEMIAADPKCLEDPDALKDLEEVLKKEF
jgi:hypothetical protein